MAKSETKSNENLMKCDEGDLSVQETMCENRGYKSLGASLTREIIDFREVSEKVNKYELKNGMPNISEEEEEDTSQDELRPIAFVAVPPVAVKREELNDQCVSDTQLPDLPEEDPYDSDMSREINVKEELDVPSCLEIKLEVKDDMSNDGTVGSVYSEDDFVEGSGTIEIKSESICDVFECDMKEEKPIKTCLDIDNFEGDKTDPFALKKKNETLECTAEESSSIGIQRDMFEKFDHGHENQLEIEDTCVMEQINTPNMVVGTVYNNTAIDKTCGFSNSGVNPKMKGNGLKTNSYSYICSNCDMVFSSKTLYDQYLLSHSEHMNNVLPSNIHSNNDLEEDEPSSCSALKKKLFNIGEVSFNCTQQLQRWSQTYSQKIPFSCPICKKPFSEKKIVDLNCQNQKSEKCFHCGVCEKSFCVKANLDTHMRTHSAEKRLQCNVCGKSYSIESKLYTHMQSHCAEKDLECNVSEGICSVKSKLDSHMKTHSGENPFECGVCHKSLSGKDALKVHMRTHTGEKPFSCVICNDSFSTKYGLVVHTQIHTGFKPFACNLCEKSFYAKNSLTKHMRSHTGEQLYKCEVCNKSFSEKSVLKDHMQTHPFKPFPCGVCEKSFSFKAGLTMHMRSHTGEKLYTCDFCNKSFVESSKLRIHTRTHTGEKPFECDICHKSFSHKSAQKRHLRLHTGENPDV